MGKRKSQTNTFSVVTCINNYIKMQYMNAYEQKKTETIISINFGYHRGGVGDRTTIKKPFHFSYVCLQECLNDLALAGDIT